MRDLLEFNPNVADERCETCRQHQYLVMDSSGDWRYLHSYVGEALNNIVPGKWIHFWGSGINKASEQNYTKQYPNFLMEKPNCMKSFKLIVGG